MKAGQDGGGESGENWMASYFCVLDTLNMWSFLPEIFLPCHVLACHPCIKYAVKEDTLSVNSRLACFNQLLSWH